MGQRTPAIEVRDLWERYRLWQERTRSLKELILLRKRGSYRDLWALKGVSLEVEEGEALAVIGPNGSGKSTLLKVLAGILPPDRGEVKVRGRVGSLLELGAGFHGDLTGRENIYLAGSILGLSRREISRKFDEIVAFSGLKEFIDTPVRSYSSGMYVRLGFSVAVSLEPDVLLVDEILAVGDEEFQARCMEKMWSFRRQGRTMVLVTHDLQAAEKLADRAVLLMQGAVVAEGPVPEVAAAYHERLGLGGSRPGAPQAAGRFGTGGAEIVQVEVVGEDGRRKEEVAQGERFLLRATIKFLEDLVEPVFWLRLRGEDEALLYETDTQSRAATTGRFKGGEVVEALFWLRANLGPGTYHAALGVGGPERETFYDWWTDACSFRVVGGKGERGRAALEARIELRAEAGGERPPGEILLSC